MIHAYIFYVPVNFAFNLLHHVISYMHHTAKKESKKQIKNKKIKKMKKYGYDRFALRGFEPGPPESVRTKLDYLSKRCQMVFKRGLFSVVIDSFQA